ITTETTASKGGTRLNQESLRGTWPSSLSQSRGENPLKSLSRSITPPPRPRPQARQQEAFPISTTNLPINQYHQGNGDHSPRLVSSPVKLTYIRDVSSAASGNNADTIKLKDILGDPMIRECWQFNYCFDVDFLMSQFDEDVRGLVRVKIVHGSWKKEAPNRILIDEACSRYPNVEAIVAYMPEPFGTHHSKMMILLRHDDLAQVVIHTANMIPLDWENMCQAVWQSPLLPMLATQEATESTTPTVIGSGERFKRDLLAYLDAYGNKKTGPLFNQLRKYDFSSIRAALIASVPSKEKLNNRADSSNKTLWGWPALKDIIHQVPLRQKERAADPHIVVQISSIATLGATDKWLKEVLFDSLSSDSTRSTSSTNRSSKFSIIFPTADEIRRSLNGYGSGGSIHMKLQSTAQQKQLQYMRPYFCHWAGDKETSTRKTLDTTGAEATKKQIYAGNNAIVKREAGRRRAAPHIKTYIRFSDAGEMDRIDWAMVTSANFSTQAWGAAANANGEVRICSWEIGVIVWPDLFADDYPGTIGGECAMVEMVPCFKQDLPLPRLLVVEPDKPQGSIIKKQEQDLLGDGKSRLPAAVVGFRMPYDLPISPYSPNDVPWCATASHTEPDWLGQTWDI
ncbi:hypothetical protein Egran_02389, partial [Elaphomyces granulatus]